MSELSEKQISKAVEWWCDALRNPKFDTLGTYRHRQHDRSAEMAEVLATAAHHENSTKEAEIIKFGEALKRRLETKWPDDWFDRLRVDYQPEGYLIEAAREAGIRNEMTAFPWKTGMKFEDGGVQVAGGYGAEWIEILNKD